jgi:hypothetical protein
MLRSVRDGFVLRPETGEAFRVADGEISPVPAAYGPDPALRAARSALLAHRPASSALGAALATTFDAVARQIAARARKAGGDVFVPDVLIDAVVAETLIRTAEGGLTP